MYLVFGDSSYLEMKSFYITIFIIQYVCYWSTGMGNVFSEEFGKNVARIGSTVI
jgi:hypothetical protein